jgi:hypothetical protein
MVKICYNMCAEEEGGGGAEFPVDGGREALAG